MIFTYDLRMGMVTTAFVPTDAPWVEGIYISGRRWWSKGFRDGGRPIVVVFPDDMIDDNVGGDHDNFEPLPSGVTVAMSINGDMVVL